MAEIATEKITAEMLGTEIKKCLLISDDEKKYWLDNLGTFPESVIRSLYADIAAKNKMINGYLEAAIASDSENILVPELKRKVKKLKSSVLQIEEQEQQPDAENLLSQNLSQI